MVSKNGYRDRQVVSAVEEGYSKSVVAAKFGVTPTRIAQILIKSGRPDLCPRKIIERGRCLGCGAPMAGLTSKTGKLRRKFCSHTCRSSYTARTLTPSECHMIRVVFEERIKGGKTWAETNRILGGRKNWTGLPSYFRKCCRKRRLEGNWPWYEMTAG